MADQTQLYDALRKADAAGDVAGAKRLAEYIRGSAAPAIVEAPKPQVGPEDIQAALAAGDSTTSGGQLPGIKDIAQAIPQGVNSNVADLAGLPMDAATNATNLLKAGAGYATSKITGNAPPKMLEADNPEDVPGTSAFIKKHIRQAGGANFIDPADNPAAQGMHAVAETIGIAPLAHALGASEPPNINAAGKVVDAPVLGSEAVSGAPKVGQGSALETARAVGYKVRPIDVEAANPATAQTGVAMKLGQKLAGGELQDDLRLHNQTISTRLGGEDIGMKNATKITPEDLTTAQTSPSTVYKAAGKQVGGFEGSPELRARVSSLLEQTDLSDTARTELGRIKTDIESGKEFTGDEVISRISDLRDRKGGRVVANALEDEIGRQLEQQGSNTTLQDYRSAREKFAKIYDVQRSLGRGGQVDALKIAALHKKYPNMLTGNLRIIGESAQELPDVLRQPNAPRGNADITEWLGDLAHTVTGAKWLGNKVMQSDAVQNKFGVQQTPTEATYNSDFGRRPVPASPAFQPAPAPPLQLAHQPGEVPIPASAQVDPGAARAPANNPAELNSVLQQTAAALKANPPAPTAPYVSPTIHGQLALPAPGQLAPRGAQEAAIKITPAGTARLSDPVRDFINDTGTEGNPSEARRATMSTILAKNIREPPALPANWLQVERNKPGNSHLSIEDARRKYIIEALRNSP